MMEFDNLDGFLIEKGDKIYDTSNRAMKYGDGIFETLKLVNGKVMFWDDHYKRLKSGIDYLGLDDTSKDKAFWEKEIEKIIVKNFYKQARIRLLVYRNAPGLYTPMSNRISYLVEGTRFDKPSYGFTSEGIKLGVFEKDFKGQSPLNNLKTTSALLFVLAGKYKKEQGFDDVVVLNTNGNVCETVSSNIFAVIQDRVITPALTEGCLNGVMRKQVIGILKQKQIEVIERDLTLDELRSAEEIFISNSMSGVQGVESFEGVKKYNIYTKQLQDYLEFILQ